MLVFKLVKLDVPKQSIIHTHIYIYIILCSNHPPILYMLYRFSSDLVSFQFISYFFHALLISLQDHWSFTDLSFFFLGGGGAGRSNNNGTSHGNRWVHCMVPWRFMSRMPCCNPVRVGVRWAGLTGSGMTWEVVCWMPLTWRLERN